MHECHFKKAKFLNGNKIDKKTLIQYTKKVFVNQTAWIENGVKAFDMCVDHCLMYVDDIRSAFDTHKFDLKQCDPMYMSVETCAFMHLFRNCPVSDWKDSETCNKWKAHLEMCHDEEETIVMLNNVTVEQMKEEGLINI
uniref:CSON006729 protein n=1 Tax=Culicoides sonorensis TaxID=179676 RepID=A0A336N593_CULSO